MTQKDEDTSNIKSIDWHRQNRDNPKNQGAPREPVEDTFEETARKNRETKERVEKERKEANERLKKELRLKK